MSNVAIKLIAVSGVVGLGVLMFLQAQKGIQTGTNENQPEAIETTSSSTTPPDATENQVLTPSQLEAKIASDQRPAELSQQVTQSAAPLGKLKKKQSEMPFAPNTKVAPSKIKLTGASDDDNSENSDSQFGFNPARKSVVETPTKGLDFRETPDLTEPSVENPFSEPVKTPSVADKKVESAPITAQPELKTKPEIVSSPTISKDSPFKEIPKTTIPPRENFTTDTKSENPFDKLTLPSTNSPAQNPTLKTSPSQNQKLMTDKSPSPDKTSSSETPFELSKKSSADTPTLDSNPFMTTPGKTSTTNTPSVKPVENLTPEVEPDFNPFNKTTDSKSPEPAEAIVNNSEKKSKADAVKSGQPVVESSPFQLNTPPKLKPEPEKEPSDVVVIKKRKTETKPAEPPLFTIEGTSTKEKKNAPSSIEINPTPEPKPLSLVDGDQPAPKETPKLKTQQKVKSPKMVIQKLAPPEAVLGQPFIYHVLVKNTGTTPAQEVIVEDRVPKGSKLTGTIPRAEQINDRIIWRLGAMGPGTEKKISIRVIPEKPGQIGSVATVNFATEVNTETKITSPKLAIKSDQPKAVNPGEITVVNYLITNSGTGDAKNVYVRSIIPPQFSHPGGDDLEYNVGLIPAGETKQIQLKLKAIKPGAGKNISSVMGDGNVKAETEVPLKVIGNGEKILLTRRGPKNRYLGRPCTFENVVTNNSEAPIQDISVFESIPPGMKFISASANGQFDPVRKVVQWDIPQLAASDMQVLSVELESTEVGKMVSTVQVVIDNSSKFSANLQSETTIIGQPLLKVETSELQGPLEIGEKMVMQVQLKNQGSAPATNVEFRVKIPRELVFLSAKGPLRYKQAGSYIIFGPAPELSEKATLNFELSLAARNKGDARVLVQVQSKQMQKPLSKEEAVPVLDKLQ